MDKSDRYKLKKYIDNLRDGKNTGFIDFNKLNNISYILKKNEYNIYYPYPDSEKVILYTDNIPKIDIIRIYSYYQLKHNEILGSLFGLNIDMEYVGDIIIDKDNYYVIVLSSISKVILDNLDMIGNKSVKLSIVSIDNISNYKKEFETREIIVSSLRIDNVIARIINTSRSKIKEKIQNKEIILNYNILTNSSYILKENDIFSIRRYGKYKFISIVKTTKKDNYIIRYNKYI